MYTEDVIKYCIQNEGFCVSKIESGEITAFACIRFVKYSRQYSCYEINLLAFVDCRSQSVSSFIGRCIKCSRRMYADKHIETKLNVASYNASGKQLYFAGERVSLPSCAKRVDIVNSPQFGRARSSKDYKRINTAATRVSGRNCGGGIYSLERIVKNDWFIDYLSADRQNFYRFCRFQECWVLYDYASKIPVDYISYYLISNGKCAVVLEYHGKMVFFKRGKDIYTGKVDKTIFLPF